MDKEVSKFLPFDLAADGRTKPDKEEQVKALMVQGLGIHEISRKLEIPYPTVQYWYKKLKSIIRVETRVARTADKESRVQERNEQIKKLLVQGLTVKEISAKLDCSISSVTKFLYTPGLEGARRKFEQKAQEDYYLKWEANIQKAGDYWLEEERKLLAKREANPNWQNEQAEKHGRKELPSKGQSPQNNEEREQE